MTPGCPWRSLAAYGPANIKWCEERLCAWVNEPANAWSNLAFVLVAAAVVRIGGGQARWWAPLIATMGVCSFVYHASNVWLTQVLDFLGMYMFCCLLLALNLGRLGWLSASALPRVYAATVLGLTLVTAVIVRFGAPIQVIVLGLIVATVVTEWLCRRRGRTYRLGGFFAALGLMAAAITCSLLDAARVWCEPGDHVLQGHAMWHVLSAASLLPAFVHYRQFAR